jgi:spore coat protein CotH
LMMPVMMRARSRAMRLASSVPLAILLMACGAGSAASGPSGSSPSPSGVSPSAGPQSVDPVFDQSRLHEVRIVMDPKDWQALRDEFWTNQYYAANIAIDGTVVEQVGIRSRGDGSRNEVKPGLKIDFNKYIKTQEFHGYKTMVLDNLYQDVSLMRERLAFTVFEAMGIPAPQNAFARLTVNDEYWGLYALVESVSKPFLKNRLGQESGNLFDYEYAYAWDFSFRGDEAFQYVPSPFQPETNEDKLDPSALVSLVRTVTQADQGNFSTALAPFLDIPQFINYVATENALAENDGFLGQQGVNNFFLYQYGGTTRFTFIPWDKDTSFSTDSYPVLQGVAENVLARRLFTDPVQLKAYQDALRKAAGFVSAGYLGPKLEQAYGQIREAAITDTHKPINNTEWELAVGGLRGVIAARAGNVLAQLPQ